MPITAGEKKMSEQKIKNQRQANERMNAMVSWQKAQAEKGLTRLSSCVFADTMGGKTSSLILSVWQYEEQIEDRHFVFQDGIDTLKGILK